ncbi:MAG: GHKL domain-containing protein [Bacteroidales bacterium]|nr:GHKL domain-containing protein [Bacteroidales bacterium]
MAVGFALQKITLNNGLSQRQVVQFQKIINEKERFLQRFCSEVQALPDSAKFSDYDVFRQKKTDWIQSQNITFFVFDNQKLAYWSDNTISPIYQLLKQDAKMFFSGNAWYLMHYGKQDNREFFILTLIKKQYPFENEYIRNEFQKDFNVSSTAEVYNEPCDNTFYVNDLDGNFLLSLSSGSSSGTCAWQHEWALLFCIIGFAFFLLFLVQFPREMYLAKLLTYCAVLLVGAALYKIPMLDYPPIDKDVAQLYSGFLGMMIIAFFVFSVNVKIRSEILLYVIFALVSFLICGTATGFIKSLALHSNIKMELFNLLSSNILSYISYFLIACLLFLYFVFCFRFARSFEYEKKYSLAILLALCVLFPILLYFVINPSEFYGFLVLFYLITTVSIVLFTYYKKDERSTFIMKILFLVLSVVYVETAVSMYLNKHKELLRKEIATALADEQDGVAEAYLASVYKSTRKDAVLKKLMRQQGQKDVEIKNYLQKTYFTGWLNRYELECTVCGTDTSFTTTNKLDNCERYFKQMIMSSGKSISDTNYYFINNQDGNITYFDSIQYAMPNGSTAKLYIEMHSKQNSQEFGYPKILLDDEIQTIDIGNFSSAKYKNGNLIAKRGYARYSQKLDLQCDETFTTLYDEQLHIVHLIYKINNQFIVVVSNRTYQFKNYLMWFPYIFLYFLLLMLVFLKCYDKTSVTLNHSLSAKIKQSLVGLLLGAFVIVAVSVILFIKSYNERQQKRFLEEKVVSVAKQFSQTYQDFPSLPLSEKAYIKNLLVELSSVYATDVNLFDVNGDLYASSRPEIFQFRLVNEKMPTRAYVQMIEKSRSTFSQEESIGDLQYLSSYIAVTNTQNQVLGYLNLPDFSNEEEFKQQMVGLIMGLLNILVILLLLAAIISVIIAKRVSEPLTILQNKMTSVVVGEENEKIDLQVPDELTGVIQNYNEMIDKLSVSAEKLAKAERESAWREMARQIAHEIKNPLTPMKLSLQLLNRSWDEKDERFESRLKSISKTMIEQIDTLADTATSFSDFAKLSKVNLEKIDINELIQSCVVIFSHDENVEVRAELPETPVFVLADKEKTIRLFNNLIKNAIQSIPKERQGLVRVTVSKLEKSDFAIIKVIDNGRGIPEEIQSRIFELHFTTKSTGSGFGLAICKSVAESSNGRIYFETEQDKGTTFCVELPLAHS